MILVDSSVWIDFLRAIETPQSLYLHSCIDRIEAVVGDLVLFEVLQGCKSERDFQFVLAYLGRLPQVEIGGRDIAVEAARNYRLLRGKGITVRRTIDCLIATRCMRDGLRLLHSDRDFDAFEAHLGLNVVR